MTEEERNAMGVQLTRDVLASARPIVQGKPMGVVVEVMCAVTLATVMGAGGFTTPQRRMILRRFADRIEQISDMLL
jgi:hypothetical protein